MRSVPPIELHLSPEDIAELLRVHPRTVIRWIRSGRLTRACRLGGRTYRVPQSAVAAFLDRRTTTL
jgi:excisionase family DNA binding protein